MPHGQLTVAELQKILDDIPGDAIVMVKLSPSDDQPFVKRRDGTPDMRQAIWGDYYNSREVRIAYGCNDDRYDQNRTVCLELGDFGP